MDNLKVPYALNIDSNLVRPFEAQKGEELFCPSCHESLVVKAGEKLAATGKGRIRHFAHPANANCSQESILHITGKMLVSKAIKDNAKHNKSIVVKNTCDNCENGFDSDLPGGMFSYAREEVCLKDITNAVNENCKSYRFDVVAYRGDSPSLIIEVCVSNPVSEEKGGSIPGYWIELKAEDLIENHLVWKPTQKKLKNKSCPECINILKPIQEVSDFWGIDRRLYSVYRSNHASVNYIAALENCFRCKQKTPVFWWSGIPFCETEPPEPRPHTIKYKFSKQFGGAYWVNTCANCGVIQGDNHIFLFESAPLKGLPISDKFMPKHVKENKNMGGATKQMLKIMTRNFRPY